MANSIPFMDYNSLYANPLYYSNGPAIGSALFSYSITDSEGNVVYKMPKMPEAYKEKREFFKFLKENKLFSNFCRGVAEAVQSEISQEAQHWMTKLGYKQRYKYLFTNPREYSNTLIKNTMDTTFKDYPIEQAYMLCKLIKDTPRNSFKMV
jgi:hypothetical protein